MPAPASAAPSPAEVARVYRALPESERPRATIVTGNYGEAGALDRYGPALGLPRAYSGHNGFWYFGRPADTGGPTIDVGPEGTEGAAYLRRFWTDVTAAGRSITIFTTLADTLARGGARGRRPHPRIPAGHQK